MSSVRMCDRCGAIFSELKDGWQTFQATTIKRDKETGGLKTVSVPMDACPNCAVGTNIEPPEPRLAEPKAEPPKALKDGSPEKIDALEKEVGIGQSEG